MWCRHQHRSMRKGPESVWLTTDSCLFFCCLLVCSSATWVVSVLSGLPLSAADVLGNWLKRGYTDPRNTLKTKLREFNVDIPWGLITRAVNPKKTKLGLAEVKYVGHVMYQRWQKWYSPSEGRYLLRNTRDQVSSFGPWGRRSIRVLSASNLELSRAILLRGHGNIDPPNRCIRLWHWWIHLHGNRRSSTNSTLLQQSTRRCTTILVSPRERVLQHVLWGLPLRGPTG